MCQLQQKPSVIIVACCNQIEASSKNSVGPDQTAPTESTVICPEIVVLLRLQHIFKCTLDYFLSWKQTL